MSDDRRRDGSKPTFAELDKRRRERRDRRDKGKGPGKGTARGHAQKAYRAALEKAFEEGRVDEFAETLSRASERKLPLTDRPAPRATPSTDAAELRSPEEAEALRQSPEELEAEAKRQAAARKERAKRRELQKKIRDAADPKEVTAAVDRYLAKFESLPLDYELLEKALRHRSAQVVLQALQGLETLLERDKPRRSRSLSMRLALLEDTHDDDDVRELAGKIREAL